MAVNKIDKKHFDSFKPGRMSPPFVMITEKSWFRSTTGNVIGIVFHDDTDNDRGFVIQGRDGLGQFRAVRLVHSLSGQIEAEKQIRAKMLELEDRTVFADDKGLSD